MGPFTTGASMYVRRKFSASAFRSDIRDNSCTHMVYIGELCRYLTNTTAEPDDADATALLRGTACAGFDGVKQRYVFTA